MLKTLLATIACTITYSKSLDPPSYEKKAETARYMANNLDWGVLSTISTRKGLEGMPFGNPISISDGGVNNSTGIPYFYTSSLD